MFGIYSVTEDGFTIKKTGNKAEDVQPLCNFSAEITKETHFHNGMTTTTVFEITGRNKSGPLPPVSVQADKFHSMAWITPAWGIQAIILPGSGVKEDLRAAIQMLSVNAITEHVYQHTGWTVIDGKTMYLHGAGAITEEGHDATIKIELPRDLSNYELPEPTIHRDAQQTIDAWEASTHLAFLADADKMSPIVTSLWRSALSSADYAVHCTGRSGSFKSEVTSLIQSHFGLNMDARHLPGSWNSTPNALEALAFRIKDAIFTIDDYIPVGTSWQIKQYSKTADQLIRGAGNQQGRARLTDVSSLQQTMYPRGLILSTGEDTPEGQSLRGRMMIIELSKDDVTAENLTKCQKRRGLYPIAMANFIQWIAQRRDAILEKFAGLRIAYRDENLNTGHSRTPQMVGDMLAARDIWIEHGRYINAIEEEAAKSLSDYIENGLKQSAEGQLRFLQDSDPVQTFLSTLIASITSYRCHVVTIDGGTPENAELLGWYENKSGTLNDYSPRGTKIGWVDTQKDQLFLDAVIAYEEIKKHSHGSLTITAQTLWKRLKEADQITTVDSNRQRNTIRMTCERSQRTVVAMKLSSTLSINHDEASDDPYF